MSRESRWRALLVGGLFIVSAAALLRAQRPDAALIPKGTNTLFGRVLDMGGDQPVGGAIVTLIGFFDAAGRPADRLPTSALISPLASAPRSVMTTADGSFLFRDLPAGRYAISADAFGYVPNSYPMHLVEVVNRVAPTDTSLRIWKMSAISGTVRDDSGEPVVGIQVSAFRSITTADRVMLRGSASTTVETDDRGAYRITDIVPGRYVVAVLSSSRSLPANLGTSIDGSASNRTESSAFTTALLRGGGVEFFSGAGQRIGDFVLQRPASPPLLAPDGRMLTFATTLYPGTTTLTQASVITLGSGENRAGIDVPLRFAPAVQVSGVALGPDGPMAGLTLDLAADASLTTYVNLEAITPQGIRYSFEPRGTHRAVTDTNGAFRFLAVSPGPYMLTSTYLQEATPDRPGFALRAEQPVAVDERGVTGITVMVKTGARVSGRLEFKGADTPTPESMRGAIGLTAIEATFSRSVAARVNTDRTFTTGGSTAGRYLLYAGGFEPWQLESVTLGGKLLADDMITIGTDDLRDLVLTFSKTPTRVSGSVAGTDGAPDPNADVIVFPADTALWREGVISNRRERLTHPTSAGVFEINELAPGEYYAAAVSARSVIVWDDPAFLDRLTSGATRFTLAAGEDKALTLKTMAPRDR